MITRRLANAAVLSATLLAISCGGETVSNPARPEPPDRPVWSVVAGKSSGPVTIQFAGANITPGSTISGCGPQIAGCAGSVQMEFRLTPTASGPVLWAIAWLHATNQQACLIGTVPAFDLVAGQPRNIVITFDQFDACGVPLTIANMALVVEGTVQVASRQEWSINYTFTQ